MKKFRYKWDWLNIIVTIVVLVILIISLIISYFSPRGFIFWFMLIMCLPAFISPLFCCPLSVEKEGNDLWINFPLRRKHIDLSDCEVERVRRLGAFEYMRTFGASAFFGYWGHFSKDGEPYLFYLTHSKENICLISSPTSARKLMINAPYEWFQDEEVNS